LPLGEGGSSGGNIVVVKEVIEGMVVVEVVVDRR
jgi:hypothetical protein